jgi:hypothetical protein
MEALNQLYLACDRSDTFGGFMRPMNGDAVEMIPIRLLISIVVIAAILLLVAVASESLRVSLAEHQVEGECRRVLSSLSTMVASGVARDVDAPDAPDGTLRVHTIRLPDSLLYLSFGGAPDPLNTGEVRPTLTADGAAVFYRVQGGSIHVIWLPADIYKFREGTLRENTWVMNGTGESFIIRQGGTLTLTFELVQQNHVRYILVHAQDEIE